VRLARDGLAVNQGWWTVLKNAGWTIEEHIEGVDGFAIKGRTHTGDPYSIIISSATEDDGNSWLHASIFLGDDKTPSYAHLQLLHRAFFGRMRWAYQVFPPASEHVNLHEVLHLFGRSDGRPALPDFTQGSRSI
jgi:hypothetical protein